MHAVRASTARDEGNAGHLPVNPFDQRANHLIQNHLRGPSPPLSLFLFLFVPDYSTMRASHDRTPPFPFFERSPPRATNATRSCVALATSCFSSRRTRDFVATRSFAKVSPTSSNDNLVTQKTTG